MKLLSRFTDLCAMLFCALVVLIGGSAFAQTAVPAPTFLDAIIAFVKTPPGYLSAIVAGLEMLMRMLPTPKAMSLLVPLKYALGGLSIIFAWVSDSVLDPLIATANNVTPPAPKPLK